jgi:hypothetical protein
VSGVGCRVIEAARQVRGWRYLSASGSIIFASSAEISLSLRDNRYCKMRAPLIRVLRDNSRKNCANSDIPVEETSLG